MSVVTPYLGIRQQGPMHTEVPRTTCKLCVLYGEIFFILLVPLRVLRAFGVIPFCALASRRRVAVPLSVRGERDQTLNLGHKVGERRGLAGQVGVR